MKTLVLTVRAVLYASGFFLFWGWLDFAARRFDPRLGGALPEWTPWVGWPLLIAGMTHVSRRSSCEDAARRRRLIHRGSLSPWARIASCAIPCTSEPLPVLSASASLLARPRWCSSCSYRRSAPCFLCSSSRSHNWTDASVRATKPTSRPCRDGFRAFAESAVFAAPSHRRSFRLVREIQWLNKTVHAREKIARRIK